MTDDFETKMLTFRDEALDAYAAGDKDKARQSFDEMTAYLKSLGLLQGENAPPLFNIEQSNS